MEVWSTSQPQLSETNFPRHKEYSVPFLNATTSRCGDDSVKGRRISPTSVEMCSPLTYDLRDGDFDASLVDDVKVSDGLHTANDD